jgi:ribonuclease P protein component
MGASVKTLKASPEFKNVSKQGKKWFGPAFVMQVLKKDGDGAAPDFRLGLTVSRRVGNAVVRNRAKRRLRETVRLFLKDGRQTSPCDVVLIAKTTAVTRDFKALQADFVQGLHKLGVLADTGTAPEKGAGE